VESNEAKAAILPLDPLKLCYGKEITESLLADVKIRNDIEPIMEQISGKQRRAINIETTIASFQAAEDKRTANQQFELQKKEAAAEKRAANQQLNLQKKEAAEEKRATNQQPKLCKKEAVANNKAEERREQRSNRRKLNKKEIK
jgi:hypothetical protein